MNSGTAAIWDFRAEATGHWPLAKSTSRSNMAHPHIV